MLGQALAQKGMPGAIESLKTARLLTPTVDHVAWALAGELRKKGYNAEAVHEYREAIALAPALETADTYVHSSASPSRCYTIAGLRATPAQSRPWPQRSRMRPSPHGKPPQR